MEFENEIEIYNQYSNLLKQFTKIFNTEICAFHPNTGYIIDTVELKGNVYYFSDSNISNYYVTALKKNINIEKNSLYILYYEDYGPTIESYKIKNETAEKFLALKNI